ncbi:type II toxin-antitoxin system RelE/ParE family toxin [Vibrio sp. Isolate25]|uniref:type II toxin-antitoxin system RelE/ParE family toxin n=1 Tax=Vibrio sp. Isolate25 TaxID=2908535 RepID=UPI001EFCEC35|nr:type II toxin-antitoxin system RelE/ParE family toxin [Vibrio sp. Isolate25]MCG9597067.1 type II toxin-antitoxin system RelE/ParE family toxin [Vibrio sp. Isolate25]
MDKQVNIQLTDTFDKTLDNVIAHYSQWNDEAVVIERVEEVLEEFEQQVSGQPYSYSRNPELVSLGVNSVRNANSKGFRLLYEVNETENEIRVDLLLFLSTKQSVEKQLVDYCLYQNL